MVDVAKRRLVVLQTEGRSLAVTEKGAVAQRQRRKEELREQVCVAGRLSFPHRAPLGFAAPSGESRILTLGIPLKKIHIQFGNPF